MTEIPEMCNGHIVDMRHKHHITAEVGALLLVVEGAYAGNQDATDFVLTGPIEHVERLLEGAQGFAMIVIVVVMANCGNARGLLAYVVATHRLTGIHDDDAVAPANPKSRMPKILNFCHDMLPLCVVVVVYSDRECLRMQPHLLIVCVYDTRISRIWVGWGLSVLLPGDCQGLFDGGHGETASL